MGYKVRNYTKVYLRLAILAKILHYVNTFKDIC